MIIEVPEDFFQERLSHVSRERLQFVRGLPLGFQQQRLREHRMHGTIAAPVHGQFGASGQRPGPGLSWHVWSVSDFGRIRVTSDLWIADDFKTGYCLAANSSTLSIG